MMNKCCQIVFGYNSIYIKVNRRCKNKTSFNIKNKKYCWIHAIKMFYKSVLIIQKMYRGYLYRKKIAILFTPLPRDLQEIVLWHMNKDIYYRNYKKCIQKILNKKYNNFIAMITANNLNNLLYIEHKHIDFLQNIINTYSSHLNCFECANRNNLIDLYLKSLNNTNQANYFIHLIYNYNYEYDYKDLIDKILNVFNKFQNKYKY